MSDHCCEKKSCELEKMTKRQSKVLWIVLGVNAVMFVVELFAGIESKSLSLIGDSLDMLGDAIVYGISLYVINKGTKLQAQSSLLIGCMMFLSAVAVFAQATYQAFVRTTPEFQLMSTVALIALGANLLCVYLLARHRNDNINMSSVWLCSRNDIIANISVVAAAGLVFLTGSFWPDLLTGLMLTFLFAKSAGTVLSKSWKEFIK